MSKGPPVAHHTDPRFWQLYSGLRLEVQIQAKKNIKLLQSTPGDPSLHFKPIASRAGLWSVQVDRNYRALAVLGKDGLR